MEGPPPLGGDQSKAAEIKTVHGTLTSLCIIIVILRFIARAKGSKHFSWDDWIMLAALVRSLFKCRILLKACSEIVTVSHNNRFRTYGGFDEYWLRQTYLLLGHCTNHSSWKATIHIGVHKHSNDLCGEIIRDTISIENWRSTKMAPHLTLHDYRPLNQLDFCVYYYTFHAV